MRKTKLLTFDNLILLILFLCGMNFQSKFFYFAFGLFILQCLIKGHFHADQMFWAYFIFSVVYGIYGYISAGIMEAVRRLAFLCVYLVGYDSVRTHSSVTKNNEAAEAWFRKCVTIFSGGAFSHYFFNMMLNMGSAIGRNTLDIWTHEILSATGQAVLVCPMIGVAVAGIIAPESKKSRIVFIFSVLIILAYNMILAGRTLIVMLLLDILLCTFVYLKYKGNLKTALRVGGTVVVVVLLVAIVYQTNIFGIRSTLIKSNLYSRFFGGTSSLNVLETDRLFSKKYYFTHMWRYMFGGQHMNRQVGYAHDLVMDCFDEAGIFATVPLLFIICSSAINVIKLVKIHRFDYHTNILVLSFYFCIFLQFFMEPILKGERWLFAGYCLINGCVNASLRKIRKPIVDNKDETIAGIEADRISIDGKNGENYSLTD